MAYPRELNDEEPLETREWLDALEYVLEHEGGSIGPTFCSSACPHG